MVGQALVFRIFGLPGRASMTTCKNTTCHIHKRFSVVCTLSTAAHFFTELDYFQENPKPFCLLAKVMLLSPSPLHAHIRR